MARATPDLNPGERTAIATDQIVRSDLALACVLQGLGRHAEAESLLRRVSGYLFRIRSCMNRVNMPRMP